MSTAEDDLKWCGEIRHTADHRTTNWRMGNWVINKSGYLVASSTSGHIECRKHLKDLSKLPPRPPTGCMLNIDFSGASMSIRFKEDPKLAADLFEVIKMKVERIGPVTLSRSVQKNSASNSSALSSSRSSGGGLVGVVRSTAKSLPVSKKPQNAAESSRYSPVVEALSSSARSSQAKTNTPPDAAVFASPSVATPSAIIWDENSAFDDVVRETPEERWPVANHDSRRELSTTQTPIAAHLANLFNADSPLPEDKENRPNVRRPANPSRGPLASNVQASLPTESFYGKNSVSSQPEIRRALTAFDRSPEKRALRKRKRGPLQGYLSEYSPKHRRTLTDANQIKFGNENLSPFKYSSVGRTPEKDFASASFQGFSNLGNTCYMNAILQAIFGVETFTHQLRSALPLMRPNGDQQSTTLLRALCALLVQRGSVSGSERRRLLADVKQAISADALRFSGHLQQDAHEFLAQVLDQLKDEWVKVIDEPMLRGERPPPLNPVTSNFTFTLRHQIKCESCGNIVTKDEEGVDMALQVSPSRLDDDRTLSDRPVNIQEMLDECLTDEDVEYNCELCSGRSSIVTHRFARLPRCLIVYAKRYEFQAGMGRGRKIAVDIDIPKYLTLSGLCTEDVITHELVSSPSHITSGRSPMNAKMSTASKERSGQSVLRSPLAMSTPLSAYGGKSRRQLFDVGDSAPKMPPLEDEEDDEQLKLALERSKTDTGGARRHTRDGWDDASDLQRVENGLMTEEEQIQMAINLSLAGTELNGDVEQTRQKANSKEDVNQDVDERQKMSATDETIVAKANQFVGVVPDESGEVVPDSMPGSQEEPTEEDNDLQMSSHSPKTSSIDDDAAVQAVNRKFSLRFEPVDSQWRRIWAERLQLTSASEKTAPASVIGKEMSYDDRPARTAGIVADGNCLFRALSYAITLKQHNHVKLRHLIVTFLKEHADTFKKLEGMNEDEWAAHLQAMADDSTWGTSLELAAAATLLQTDLWTFYLSKWYLYKPRFPLENVEATSSKAIYLCNEHSHFEPVLQVTDVLHKARLLSARRQLLESNYESGKMDNSYRLSAVVSHIGSSSGSGHYISDVWDRSKNEWMECDDSSVGVIGEERVRRRRRSTGYIFIFTATSICEDGEIHRAD